MPECSWAKYDTSKFNLTGSRRAHANPSFTFVYAGHAQMATACYEVLIKLPVSEPMAPFKQVAVDERQRYALHHGVGHLGVTGDVKRLEDLVHHHGFWECVFAAGGASCFFFNG